MVNSLGKHRFKDDHVAQVLHRILIFKKEIAYIYWKYYWCIHVKQKSWNHSQFQNDSNIVFKLRDDPRRDSYHDSEWQKILMSSILCKYYNWLYIITDLVKSRRRSIIAIGKHSTKCTSVRIHVFMCMYTYIKYILQSNISFRTRQS